MITIGVDIGNVNLKSSENILIPNKVTTSNLVFTNTQKIQFNNKNYYIGEGIYDTELNKLKKEYLLPNLCLLLGKSIPKNEKTVNLVIGLPILQYKNGYKEFEELINNHRVLTFKLNDESERTIIIDKCKVFPEGLATYYSLDINVKNKFKDSEIIILDIGGRTTDLALLSSGKNRSIKIMDSLDVGTINIYSDIIKILNETYCTGLKLEDGDRVLRKGLYIDGEKINITEEIKMVLKANFDEIIKQLNVNYKAKINPIFLTGGGGNMLMTSIKKRFPNTHLVNNNLFSNAVGFKKIGEKQWKKEQL